MFKVINSGLDIVANSPTSLLNLDPPSPINSSGDASLFRRVDALRLDCITRFHSLDGVRWICLDGKYSSLSCLDSVESLKIWSWGAPIAAQASQRTSRPSPAVLNEEMGWAMRLDGDWVLRVALVSGPTTLEGSTPQRLGWRTKSVDLY